MVEDPPSSSKTLLNVESTVTSAYRLVLAPSVQRTVKADERPQDGGAFVAILGDCVPADCARYAGLFRRKFQLEYNVATVLH